MTWYPETVSRQTSQSGLSGLANQGSAQPCAMQDWTVCRATARPSSLEQRQFAARLAKPAFEITFLRRIGLRRRAGRGRCDALEKDWFIWKTLIGSFPARTALTMF